MLADENPDLALRDVEATVSTFFDEITARLADDGRVDLRGFGAFSTRARDARTGRNPRTGETVDLDAHRVPYFQPAKQLRARPHAYGFDSRFDPNPKINPHNTPPTMR